MFYKRFENNIQAAENVNTPDVELTAETKDDFEYPQEGWYWFDTFEQASASFGKSVDTVTPLQAKLALNAAGLLDNIETFIAGSDRATQIAWESASEFKRSSPLLIGMTAAIGMTGAQLDDLFVVAGNIEV